MALHDVLSVVVDDYITVFAKELVSTCVHGTAELLSPKCADTSPCFAESLGFLGGGVLILSVGGAGRLRKRSMTKVQLASQSDNNQM